jgi:hypothetical protein
MPVLTILGIAFQHWKLALGLSMAAYIGFLHLQIAGEKIHSAKVETRLRESNAALAKLEGDTRAKTALAQAQDAADVANDRAKRTQISMEKAGDHRKEVDDLKRRYDALLHLRAGAATAHPGGGGNSAVPSVPGAAPGADDPALQDGLLASEIALRLKALQEWVNAQAAVERGAPTPAD